MRSILIQAAYNLAFIVILTAMLPWLLARLLRRGQWKSGFTQRFGLVHVDFESGTRTPKSSYDWYGRVIAENRA